MRLSQRAVTNIAVIALLLGIANGVLTVCVGVRLAGVLERLAHYLEINNARPF